MEKYKKSRKYQKELKDKRENRVEKRLAERKASFYGEGEKMSKLWVKDENGETDYGKFEDDMIESMFTDPDLFCELYGRKDKYGGDTKGLYESSEARKAGRKAEKLGGDRLVARGIYLGVAAADPVFDEVGEEFLRRVLPDYSKAEGLISYMEDVFRGDK